jgi:hypothetical protein
MFCNYDQSQKIGKPNNLKVFRSKNTNGTLRWYHTLQGDNSLKSVERFNQQNQSYKFTSHIAAFLSVVLIIEMLEICIQTSYDQSVQLILKSYLPEVYGTTCQKNKKIKRADQILPEVYGTTLSNRIVKSG